MIRSSQVSAVVLFVLASCAMMPLNKVVMLRLRHTPFTAVAGQMLGGATVLLCVPSSYHDLHNVYRYLVLPPLFATMLVVSMFSLHHASLGAIMAIRNTSPLVCLPLEHLCVAPQDLGCKRIAGLVCVLCGCIAYVWNDLYTSTVGIVLVVVNMLVGVCDRLIQRHLLSTLSASRAPLLLVNNLVGGALVLALAVVTHEDVGAALHDSHARLPWASSVGVGLLIGYAGVKAQEEVSATTHLLVTNLSRVITLQIGSFVLGEHLRWVQWIAASVSVIGTVLYAL